MFEYADPTTPSFEIEMNLNTLYVTMSQKELLYQNWTVKMNLVYLVLLFYCSGAVLIAPTFSSNRKRLGLRPHACFWASASVAAGASAISDALVLVYG